MLREQETKGSIQIPPARVVWGYSLHWHCTRHCKASPTLVVRHYRWCWGASAVCIPQEAPLISKRWVLYSLAMQSFWAGQEGVPGVFSVYLLMSGFVREREKERERIRYGAQFSICMNLVHCVFQESTSWTLVLIIRGSWNGFEILVSFAWNLHCGSGRSPSFLPTMKFTTPSLCCSATSIIASCLQGKNQDSSKLREVTDLFYLCILCLES